MADSERPAEAPQSEAVWPGNLLDAPNRAIIEALQRDGRQPYGAIADEVGLSEAAVRRRVQRLREAGVMQIVAVTDPLQLGFTRQAMVGVSVARTPGMERTESFNTWRRRSSSSQTISARMSNEPAHITT